MQNTSSNPTLNISNTSKWSKQPMGQSPSPSKMTTATSTAEASASKSTTMAASQKNTINNSTNSRKTSEPTCKTTATNSNSKATKKSTIASATKAYSNSQRATTSSSPKKEKYSTWSNKMTRTTHISAHNRGHTFNDAAADRERIKQLEERNKELEWHSRYHEIEKWFKIDDHITIGTRYGDSRNGFNHFASLFIDGHEIETVKNHYINRTWESYTYQSVMQRLIEKTKALNPAEKAKAKAYLEQDHTDNSMLKTIAMVSSLGEIFGQTQKEKNDWKTRMLKAGLGNSGLEMPEDWNTLPEPEKERRLNAAITQLKK